MPTGFIHRLDLTAPEEAIFRAITTQDGIRVWWTTEVTSCLWPKNRGTTPTWFGGCAVFRFFRHAN